MRTKNLTPFQLGTKLTSRRPPKPEATILVKGTFRLVPGGVVEAVAPLHEQHLLRGDVLAEGDERSGECLYGSDFADFKLNAEVLLQGSCHAPGGLPVTECPVMFRVGAWSKMLRIVGPRFWSDGLLSSHTEPAPFTTMPIRWSNAFGGPSSKRNPWGKGWGTNELPNVESAREPMRSRSDRPEPAGFGATGSFAPERAAKVGKAYGAKWKAERAPFYAEDFDWSYFQAAPADQQIAGYFAGDEELVLQNLSPLAPVLTTRLPGLRPRVFVKDAAGRFREVRLVLDTIVALPDEGLVALVWRGVEPVAEDDLSDLAWAVLASEALGEAPKNEAHYQAILEAFERDPTGIRDAVPLEMQRALFGDEGKPEPAEEAKPEPPNALEGLLDRKLGKMQPEAREGLRAAMSAALADPKVRERFEEGVRDAERKAADTPPMPRTLEPGTFPELQLRRKMRPILEQAAKLRESTKDRDLPPPRLAQIEALEKMPFDPKWTRIDPDYTPPLEPISTEEPGPGAKLAEQDLTGRDLSGLDLSGADLRYAILTRANLRGANLDGANLRGAILFKTDATGATFRGATLDRANAAQLSAEGASFADASLGHAFFEDARLVSACLDGARAPYAIFTRAELTGATARDALFDDADFAEALLEGANLARSSFAKALLAGVRAARVDLTDARFEGASFDRAELENATLVGARGDRVLFTNARLDGAALGFTVLRGATFSGASAVRASFFGANLRDARFYRAVLEHASFERANLFSADLRKAKLTGTRFVQASLYDAAFIGASGAGTDFHGAILHRSTLERA